MIAGLAMLAAQHTAQFTVDLAFVVHAPDHVLDEATLTAYLAGRLAKFKMPRAWRFTTDALPKTGTGKILKRDLREQFWTDKTKRVQG